MRFGREASAERDGPRAEAFRETLADEPEQGRGEGTRVAWRDQETGYSIFDDDREPGDVRPDDGTAGRHGVGGGPRSLSLIHISEPTRPY